MVLNPHTNTASLFLESNVHTQMCYLTNALETTLHQPAKMNHFVLVTGTKNIYIILRSTDKQLKPGAIYK